MKKTNLLLLLSLCGIVTASAQTLFTYGQHTVDAKEFVRAYNKNNSQTIPDKTKSIKDYLDLYIKSKLKVREAYARGLDTLPGLVTEVKNLRAQIVENYMTDPEILNRLIKEAFQRSQKDIHAAFIFINFYNSSGVIDTNAANKKRDDILQRLKKGEDFLQVAKISSDENSENEKKGDLGYITVFTLPYEFENAVYGTAVGKYSDPVASKAGYTIFKNIGERKAVGKMKIQQILLAAPPGADDTDKKKIAGLADSLYKRIIGGDDFGKLATAYSNEYISAAAGGNLPEVGVGQYEPSYENILRSLTKNGAVSKPFITSKGWWHIVKRLGVTPVVTNPNDKANLDNLKQKIMTDGRWKSSGDFIYDRVIKQGGYKKLPYEDAALWAYTDSLLDMRALTNAGQSINAATPLFSIAGTDYTANDWINFARSFRFKPDGSGTRPYPQVREEWVHAAMTDYYRDHLEDFNEEFRNQMAEFKEGNMFFEIMQEEVWNKAQNDSVALLDLYNKNKKNYTWKQSADVVIFFCSDQAIAKTVYDAVKKDPKNWRRITEQYAEKVIGDSSRYEWNQIPNLNKMAPKDGMLTAPVVNSTDNTSSFAYIIKSYPNAVQRNFHEARGMVINDYQEILEKQWDGELRKKYPVKVDEKVLSVISR